MKFQQRINKWMVNVRKYLFFYKDGYYELPYISNAPDVMVASFKNMPFTRHDAAAQAIYTTNIFTEGVMYYRELEEGFWIMLTEMEFKKNICTKALYDGEPCDYYFLSHYRYTSVVANTVVNTVSVPTFGWGLYKPGTNVKAYFNEGAKGVFIDFAFNTAWFERNMQVKHLPEKHTIRQYLASGEEHLHWNDIHSSAGGEVEKILACFKDEKAGAFSTITLKMHCYNMVAGFLKAVDNAAAYPQHSLMKEADRRHLAKAEHIIIASLLTKFPGIEPIAKEVHISPTKLKSLFKELYGATMFQYYQEKQMLLAQEMLRQGATVKDAALSLGYENASNFIVAFKKYHSFLPSEVK